MWPNKLSQLSYMVLALISRFDLFCFDFKFLFIKVEELGFPIVWQTATLSSPCVGFVAQPERF